MKFAKKMEGAVMRHKSAQVAPSLTLCRSGSGKPPAGRSNRTKIDASKCLRPYVEEGDSRICLYSKGDQKGHQE